VLPAAESDLVAVRSQLDAIARTNMAFATGVADLVALRERYPDLLAKLANVPVIRAYVAAIRLHRGVLGTVEGMPNALYMHHYRQVNYQLDTISLGIAAKLESEGFIAVAVAASQIATKKPMTGHISHRLLGQWAGIGWRGRNNLLVSLEAGSQMRLVSVLTDAPLCPDRVVHRCLCGECTLCRDACPAQAIEETPESFRLDKCYDKLCEFTHIPFVSQHICGVCQRACGGRQGSA